LHRLILWNIDLTLVDVARVSRDAYAEAFRRVTGLPLVALPQLAGASDSEIFFESLALNEAGPAPGRARERAHAAHAEANDLLARYAAELATAFGARTNLLASRGRALPGARAALAAVSRLPGVIQTVLTGAIRQNAEHKLHAFGLERFLDLGIGGYGSEVYPKGTQILRSLAMATEKYRVELSPDGTVYVADSVRDVAAAKVAGVRCLGVATGRSTLSELRDAGAEPALADLSDTSQVVAAISQ
jgi:phosphoglycolate phosphatase-like HAD superfamily hydrolase